MRRLDTICRNIVVLYRPTAAELAVMLIVRGVSEEALLDEAALQFVPECRAKRTCS